MWEKLVKHIFAAGRRECCMRIGGVITHHLVSPPSSGVGAWMLPPPLTCSVVSLKYFQHHSGVSSHEQVARSDQSNRSPHGGGVVEPGPCLVGSDVQSSAGEATFSKHSLCPTPPSPHKARAYQAQRSPKWPFFLVTSSHLRPQAHTGQGWCLPTFSGAS